MLTVKANQKIFTYAEVGTLTGICTEHLRNFAKRHRLGFITRTSEALEKQAEQWLFTRWDVMVLATLFPSCSH